MKVLALAGDIAGLVAQVRLVVPLRGLCEPMGWPLTLKSFHDCTRTDVGSAEVLIVQRAASGRVWRLQRHMRQQGGAVVYEIDDLLTAVAPHISNQAAMLKRQAWLKRCMAEADVVSVSTARLGRELMLASAIEVPNHAWPVGDSALPTHDPKKPVTLLFASSDRLATDFIYPALRGLPGVQVVVVGPPAAAFEAAGIAVRRQPLMPRAQFVAFARSLPNPLGVIPLENSRFAACKSAVKWFDYAEAGVPTLCSAVSPYAEVVRDGITGALVRNEPLAWLAALQAATGDAAWRQRVAEAARACVREHHTMALSMLAWQQALEAALRRRAAVQLPAPGWAWQARDGLASVVENQLLKLRAINRARLAQRAQRAQRR